MVKIVEDTNFKSIFEPTRDMLSDAAEELPDSKWWARTNTVLNTQRRTDIDFFVIGPSKIFVLTIEAHTDETDTVFVTDEANQTPWKINDQSSNDPNPISVAKAKAVEFQSYLNETVPSAQIGIEWLVVIQSSRQVNYDPVLGDERKRVIELGSLIHSLKMSLEEDSHGKLVLTETGYQQVIDLIEGKSVSEIEQKTRSEGDEEPESDPDPITDEEYNLQLQTETANAPDRSWLKIAGIAVVAIAIVVIGYFTIKDQIGNGPSNIKIGEPVIYGAQVSFFPQISDPGNQIESYFWNFGDGQTSDQLTPIHVYNNPGSFEVTLVARGDGVDISSTSETIMVDGLLPNASCASEEIGSIDAPIPNRFDPAERTEEDKTPIIELSKQEHPVIILTREEEFVMHNELMKAVQPHGFIIAEPRLMRKIIDTPADKDKVDRVYALDCDSMASLAIYLNSYLLVAPRLQIEDLGINSQGQPTVQATVQINAYDPRTSQVLYGEFQTIPRASNTKDDAERRAIQMATEMAAAALGETLASYYGE